MFEKLLTCPYCSGIIEVTTEDAFAVCEYCGRKLEVPRFTQEEKRLTQAVEDMRVSTEAAEAALKEAMSRAEESDAQMEARIAAMAEQIAEDSVQARMHRDELMEELRSNAVLQRAQAQAHLEELKSEQYRLMNQLAAMQREQQAGKAASLQHRYELGESAQRAGRFDEAIKHFQELLVLSEDQEAEVHWRIVMCRYGVEYVQEQASGTYLPTITHMIVESIQEDANFIAAERYARSESMRAYYRGEAKRIDSILSRYRDIYGEEKPYDVFISVKQGDENGRPTEDSMTGMELYYMLTGMGLHVFNSRISLKERAGLEYEPYIMAALMRSKIMLVIGTRSEYLSAPWVRNEWRRYRWLQKNDNQSRRLIAYLVGMKASDMPNELGVLQIINASGNDPMGQLRSIAESVFADRFAKKSEPAHTAGPQEAASAVNPQEATWLKRAEMFMSKGFFDQCDEFCEKVLDLNPESGMAYVYKLCAARRVKKLDDLAEQPEPLDDDANYSFAISFGSETVIDRLTEINNKILDRIRRAKEESERESRLEQMEREMRERLEREYREKAEQAAREANEKLQRERAQREAAEKEAREKAEKERAAREAAEKAAREAREKLERERREREAAEKARAEREAAEKAAREKREREAAEKAAREKREREAAEKAEREKQERERLAQKQRESAQRSAQEGEIVTATVTSMTGIAAEVKLQNGQKGSIHVSHCAAVNVKRPSDVLKVGDVVRVKVMSENRATGKLILSIREAMSEAEKQAAQNATQAEQDRIDAQLSKNKVWEGMRQDPERAEELRKEGHEYSKKGQYKMAVPRLKMAAELGSGLAMLNLGGIYENKYTGFYNLAEAFEWFLKGAEAGEPAAMDSVAKMYENGTGVQKNLDEASKWYKKAVDSAGWEVSRRGYQRVEAERIKEKGVQNVDFLYDQGMRMYNAKQFAEAAKSFEVAANHNHADAAYQLSVMYGRGEGVAKSALESDKWLFKAGDLGSADACAELAMMYHFGTGLAKDMNKAAKWYLRAAELGHADSMYYYGMRCYNGEGVAKDLAEAEKWFRKAVEKGQKEAADMLQRLQKERVPEPSAAQIAAMNVQQLREAAERGNVAAMYQLGNRYDLGAGASQNKEEAVRWYTMAGNHGHTLAMNRVGVMHAHGQGCAKSLEKAVEWYRKSAEAGDIYGMGNLAKMLEQGIGVAKDLAGAVMWYEKAVRGGNDKVKEDYERAKKLAGSQSNVNDDPDALYSQAATYYKNKDYAQAFPLYKRAAELGHARAMNMAGYLLKNGYGVEKNPAEAVSWYKKAADQGHVIAAYNVGACYQDGTGVERNYARAAEYYRKAADGGDEDAMNNLGRLYEDGNGVAKNLAEAAKWFTRAVDKGHKSAAANLERVNKALAALKEEANDLYSQARCLDEKREYAQALELFRRAADLGRADALNDIGTYYHNGTGVARDYAKAREYYLKAVEKGNMHAMDNLGRLYGNGLGVAKDPAEAAKWYLKAAEKGFVSAMYSIGWHYANGVGVAQDWSQAVKWHQRAADQGHADAMNFMGTYYHNGTGVAKDYAKAREYYLQAADKGNMYSMRNLGILYEDGLGVAKDLAEAAKWYKKAMDAGHPNAAESLDRVNKELQKPQIETLDELYSRALQHHNKGEYDQALELFQRASILGSPEATNYIGIYYHNGTGVAKDYVKAREYYQMAAGKGNKFAMNNLGILYENGLGTPKDLAEAGKWYKKAADNGHPDAPSNLERVNKELQKNQKKGLFGKIFGK